MNSQKALQEYLQQRRRTILVYLSAILLTCVLLTYYVWQHVQVVQIRLRIAELEKKRQAIQEKIELKQAERASLARLDRIAQLATTRLGMGLPNKEQMWYLPLTSPSATASSSPAP